MIVKIISKKCPSGSLRQAAGRIVIELMFTLTMEWRKIAARTAMYQIDTFNGQLCWGDHGQRDIFIAREAPEQRLCDIGWHRQAGIGG
jgi:hypothetical protein